MRGAADELEGPKASGRPLLASRGLLAVGSRLLVRLVPGEAINSSASKVTARSCLVVVVGGVFFAFSSSSFLFVSSFDDSKQIRD